MSLSTPSSATARLWDELYSRRQEHKYARDTVRLQYTDSASLKAAFFAHRPNHLDPPRELTFAELGRFLHGASLNRLPNSPVGNDSEDVILVDDRFHTSPHAYADRFNSSEDRQGTVLRSEAMTVKAFFDLTRRENRYLTRVDRRIIFVPNPSAECILAIIGMWPVCTLRSLRGFLQRYYMFNAAVDGLCVGAPYFALGFHFPYYAIRKGAVRRDPRGLRKSDYLPLHCNKDDEVLTYNEAKVSVRIIGHDEHYYTTIAFVDTYFGSEPKKSTYLKAYGSEPEGLDPPSGGAMSMRWPCWNARKYFSAIIASRMADQIVLEWRNTIRAWDNRMKCYQRHVACFDTDELTITTDLQPAIDTIHNFKDALTTTTNAWKLFKNGHMKNFEMYENEKARVAIEANFARVEESIEELVSFKVQMEDWLLRFEGILDRVTKASALRHHALATRQRQTAAQQSDDVGILTRVSVLFLPPSLVAALFSMTIISDKLSWAWPTTAFISVGILTWIAVLKPDCLQCVFRNRRA